MSCVTPSRTRSASSPARLEGHALRTWRAAKQHSRAGLRGYEVRRRPLARRPAFPPTCGRPAGIVPRLRARAGERGRTSGVSTALMYGGLLDDICRQEGTSVAFLCADQHDGVSFRRSARSRLDARTARSLDERAAMDGEWKSPTGLVIDPGGRMGSGSRSGLRTRGCAVLVRRFDTSAAARDRVRTGRQSSTGQTVNLRSSDVVSETAGTLPSIATGPPNEPVRQCTTRPSRERVRDHRRPKVIRATVIRDDGGSVATRPSSFFYADDDMSQAGAEILRRHDHGRDHEACEYSDGAPAAEIQQHPRLDLEIGDRRPGPERLRG